MDSIAVFEARCLQLELTPAHVASLKLKRYDTYSRFAYSCAYQPYAADETPFLDMLTDVFGASPVGYVPIFRRLYGEAHALGLQDLRARCERTDDQTPQKLQAPERSARYEDQVRRLGGWDLTGANECSNALIDSVFQQYEDNSLRWLPLETLTSREQELLGQKKDPVLVEYFTKIQSGKMIVQELRRDVGADLSTDLRIKQAWTRRALAYDQAHLISFLVLERWTAKLIARMYEEPLPNYNRVSLDQCLAADKKLWQKMGEACRASIQPTSASGVQVRPLDVALVSWSDHSDVTYLIQPLQMGRAVPPPPDPFVVKAQKQKGAGKGHQKVKQEWKQQGKSGKSGGKNSGKGGRSGKDAKRSIPAGCVGKTEDGRFVCYAFNDGGCSAAEAGGYCEKGWHICGRKGCHKNHSIKDCQP